jgi:hypothetical protein
MPSAPDRNDTPLFPPLPQRRGDFARAGQSKFPDAGALLAKVRNFLEFLADVPAHLKWAGLGFAAGAVFWHFVGFWSFMSHIMFSSPETARRTASPAPAIASSAPQGASPLETGSLRRLEKLTAPKIEPSCTAVTRDKQTGQMHQSECRKLTRALRQNETARRQDKQTIMQQATATADRQPVLTLDPDVPLQWPQAVNAR